MKKKKTANPPTKNSKDRVAAQTSQPEDKGIFGGVLDTLGLPGGTASKGRSREGVVEAAAKSAARAIGSQLGRQIIRGVLGSILGGRR